jgi:integrase/recombinase XerC
MEELFDRYADYLRAEKNASEHTVRNYANDILGNFARGEAKGFLQFLESRNITALEDVDRHAIRDYIGWLMERGVVRHSISRKLSAIRSFYKYLVREEILARNPMEKGISPKRERRLPSYLTTAEVTRLLHAPDTAKPQGLRDRALLELLYASGLRVSEIVGLDLRSVDVNSREIRVRGKGSKERITLMGEPAARALDAYVKHGRPDLLTEQRETAVFVGRGGRRLLARRVQKLLQAYAAAAGIDRPVHPHMLRHTFATHLLDGGADLRVVQELMGHAHLSSTQVYTHVSKSQARRVYQAAHPFAEEKQRT